MVFRTPELGYAVILWYNSEIERYVRESNIMKKIVVVIALVYSAMCISAFADRTADEIVAMGKELLKGYPGTVREMQEYVKSLSKDEMKSVIDNQIELVRLGCKGAMGYPFDILGKWLRNQCRDLSDEVDAKLLAIDGYEDNPLRIYDTIPRTSEKILSMENPKVDYLAMYPVSVRTVRKYKSGMIWSVATFPETVNIVAEHYCFGGIAYYLGENSKNRLVSRAAKAVKRRIREQGGSFVVGSDGNNPVQNAVDELSAALNSPRMAGLNEWVGKWFPGHEWIEPKWMTDDEVKKLKDEILYGEMDFTERYKAKLEAHLGIEAYNDFIRLYNGTVK